MEIQQIQLWEIIVMPNDDDTEDIRRGCSSKSKLPCVSVAPCNTIKISTKNMKQKKKVRFDNDNLVNILEFEDDEESKDSRKRYWELFAIDRAHFYNRILNHEENLSQVLTPKHRESIYQQRFEEKL